MFKLSYWGMQMRRKTRFIGVYEREALNRKNKNKPDTAFDISYKRDGKLIWEKAGWLSEGYSAKLAADIRAERIRSMRHGLELPKDKPKTLFKDVAKKYLEWAKTNKTRDGIHDKGIYNKHLSKRFDNIRLDRISSLDLERMKSELPGDGICTRNPPSMHLFLSGKCITRPCSMGVI